MRIIVKAIAGSHLFGTNTPASDKDFKGVYLPEIEDVLLGRVKKSVNLSTNKSNTKNTSDDVDIEFYSLDKFFSMLAEGQTVAFELLFTPESHIIEKSEIWDEIVSMRDQLIHKQVKAFIGYCQQQANKYGIKGSRMGAIKSVLDAIPQHSPVNSIGDIKEYLDPLIDNNLIKIDHIYSNNQTYRYFNVCGKKFDYKTSIDDMISSLTKYYDNYGERAKQAELNQGIDWKAISHAFRVCFQAKELLTEGKITLPLKVEDAFTVRIVKSGTCSFNDVSEHLEELVQEIKNLEKTSNIRERLDQKILDNFLIKIYTQQMKEN